MRDPEARLVDLLLPVDQQVEIERPRALGRDSRTVAAETRFDCEEEVEERPGRQLGLERHDPVQEARLIQKAHRLRIDQRGDADHLDARGCGKLCDRRAKRRLAVAEVGAQPNVCTGHGRDAS